MKFIFFILSTFLINGAFAMSKVENIQFTTFDKLKLEAQIFIPGILNEKLPAVLIIEGSGKSPKRSGESSFSQLARKISEKGFFVLRFNKRGSGDNEKNGSFWKSTFTIDNKDAMAAMDFLLSQKGVDKDKVFVVGHSYGGPQALLLSKKNNNVKKIVMLTSTVMPVNDLLLTQNEIIMSLQGMEKSKIEKELEEMKKYLGAIAENRYVCEKPSCEIIDEVQVLDHSIQIPWLVEAQKINLVELAKDQRSKVLFIFGGSDFVIPGLMEKFVRENLEKVDSSKFEIKMLPKLDHFLVENESKEESLKYVIKVQKDNKFKDVSPFLVSAIVDYFRESKK